MIKTSCKDCVFAEWEDGIQLGCQLGRLEKFIGRNEASYPKDDNQTHYEIQRFCGTCRNQAWADKQKASLPEAVMKECRLQYDVIIPVGEETLYEVLRDKLTLTLNSILKQEILPRELYLVMQKGGFTDSHHQKLLTWMRDRLHGTGVKYIQTRMFTAVDSELECIDAVARKCTSTYYTVARPSYLFPDNFAKRINEAINVDLHQVSMIVPSEDSLNGLVVQVALHKQLSGNLDSSIVDKVRYLAQEQEKEEMVIEDFYG